MHGVYAEMITVLLAALSLLDGQGLAGWAPLGDVEWSMEAGVLSPADIRRTIMIRSIATAARSPLCSKNFLCVRAVFSR